MKTDDGALVLSIIVAVLSVVAFILVPTAWYLLVIFILSNIVIAVLAKKPKPVNKEKKEEKVQPENKIEKAEKPKETKNKVDEELEEIEKELKKEKLKQELNEIKNQQEVICKYCGKKNTAKKEFCSACGAKLK